MTLVITAVSPSAVVQASDRRVSWRDKKSEGGKVWYEIVHLDDARNKAIFLMPRHCVSYTGVAEIDGVRTDVWITDILANTRNHGTAIDDLSSALTDIFSRPDLSGRRLAVIISGWDSFDGGELKATFRVVSNFFSPQEGFLYDVDSKFLPHSFAAKSGDTYGIFTAGARVPLAEQRSMLRTVQGIAERNLSLETVGRYLVSEIRRVAEVGGTVGKSALVCTVPKGGNDSMFSFFADGDDDGTVHGPNFAMPGGMGATDFVAGPL